MECEPFSFNQDYSTIRMGQKHSDLFTLVNLDDVQNNQIFAFFHWYQDSPISSRQQNIYSNPDVWWTRAPAANRGKWPLETIEQVSVSWWRIKGLKCLVQVQREDHLGNSLIQFDMWTEATTTSTAGQKCFLISVSTTVSSGGTKTTVLRDSFEGELKERRRTLRIRDDEFLDMWTGES